MAVLALDMDLCCFLGKESPARTPAELVETLGRLIEKGPSCFGISPQAREQERGKADSISNCCVFAETTFQVKMLPRARIPIIKLTMPPTESVPFGMACDIGFENRLALENTRLLLTYAMVDPRLRTLVLFRELPQLLPWLRIFPLTLAFLP